MKKTLLTIAIVLGLSMTTFADPNGGGLFQRGASKETSFMNREIDNYPALPTHGHEENQPAPLGSGVAVLLGLGAAYLVGKKRSEE